MMHHLRYCWNTVKNRKIEKEKKRKSQRRVTEFLYSSKIEKEKKLKIFDVRFNDSTRACG